MDDALPNWLAAIEAPLKKLERDLRKVKSDGAKLQMSSLCAVRLASERFFSDPLSDDARLVFELVLAARIAEKCTASLT
jgi:hypothetical protein